MDSLQTLETKTKLGDLDAFVAEFMIYHNEINPPYQLQWILLIAIYGLHLRMQIIKISTSQICQANHE